jgi:uncharacterized protein YijF (DUF1287 family)
MNNKHTILFIVIILVITNACVRIRETPVLQRPDEPKGFSLALSDAALERTKHFVIYESAYKKIDYPDGDVEPNRGVCTDVVIRSYRALGIDLQKDVHEDMKQNFSLYPEIWGLKAPDPNIDHRRVPNLQVFFKRKGTALPVTINLEDYVPGDIVTWSIKGKPHIGIIVNRKKWRRNQNMVVHNIGLGPKLNDMLFKYEITGHYRYYGAMSD